jgi:hypothetical protein
MKELLDKLEGLSIQDLSSIKEKVEKLLDVKYKRAMSEVEVDVDSRDNVIIRWNGFHIIAKPEAYMGRWRVYEWVQGKRGMKKGRMIMDEHSGNIRELKRMLRFNSHWNIKFDDPTTWDCNR